MSPVSEVTAHKDPCHWEGRGKGRDWGAISVPALDTWVLGHSKMGRGLQKNQDDKWQGMFLASTEKDKKE